MTQHMLADIDLEWISAVVNVFLIRSPQEVVASYARARPDLTAADLGFEQQYRLYEHVVKEIDANPLVISADNVLQNPAFTLAAICAKANITFDDNMLSWPAGPRPSDGVWAAHWYKNVELSTGFAKPARRQIDLSEQQQKVAALCQPYYNAMLEHCLTVK